MKTTFTTLALLIACCCGTQTAQAQSIDIADYEVHFANADTTDWYIQWRNNFGEVQETWGPYNTEYGAQDRAVWAFLGGYEPTNDADIVELTMPPDWRYFRTYDTVQEARDVAEYFSDLGLLADVRRVSLIDITNYMFVVPHGFGW